MPRVAHPCLNQACRKKVAYGIQCNVCTEWAHKRCAGISQIIYELHSKHEDLEWVCSLCKQAAKIHRNLLVSPQLTEVTPPNFSGCNYTVLNSSSPRSYAEVVSKPPVTPMEKTSEKIKNTEKSEAKTKSNPKKLRPVKEKVNVKEQNLKILEDKLRELSIEVGKLKCSDEYVENGPKTILILNREEPLIRESKTRRELDRRRVTDILRMADLSPQTALKRVHRVGVWKQPNPNGVHIARPILVEFADIRTRNLLMTKAALVSQRSNGRYDITTDSPKQRKGPKYNYNYRFTRPAISPNPVENTPYIKNGVVVIEDIMEAENIQLCPPDRSESIAKHSDEKETPIRRTSSPVKNVEQLGYCESTPETVKKAVPKNGRASRAQSLG